MTRKNNKDIKSCTMLKLGQSKQGPPIFTSLNNASLLI